MLWVKQDISEWWCEEIWMSGDWQCGWMMMRVNQDICDWWWEWITMSRCEGIWMLVNDNATKWRCEWMRMIRIDGVSEWQCEQMTMSMDEDLSEWWCAWIRMWVSNGMVNYNVSELRAEGVLCMYANVYEWGCECIRLYDEYVRMWMNEHIIYVNEWRCEWKIWMFEDLSGWGCVWTWIKVNDVMSGGVSEW